MMNRQRWESIRQTAAPQTLERAERKTAAMLPARQEDTVDQHGEAHPSPENTHQSS